MNANWYFEDDPWSRLTAEVHGGSVGRVVAVAVQAICAPEQLDQTLRTWQDRLESLFGPPVDSDLLQNEQALSLLMRYNGPIVGRVFVDNCTGSPLSNVEIVGTRGLLVWKPDVHPLAVISTSTGVDLSGEHAFAVTLKEGAR